MSQNPRDCTTCHHAVTLEFGFKCLAPLPVYVSPKENSIIPVGMVARCDSHKAQKGTFVRVCLNCDKPIRTNHKYTEIYKGQWIHKYCEHPDSPSKYHHERHGS